MSIEHRPIRLDVLAALEPHERQHDEQIPLNPHELDALLAVVRAAKGVRWARRTYLGVANSQCYYDRLFEALEAFDEGDTQ